MTCWKLLLLLCSEIDTKTKQNVRGYPTNIFSLDSPWKTLANSPRCIPSCRINQYQLLMYPVSYHSQTWRVCVCVYMVHLYPRFQNITCQNRFLRCLNGNCLSSYYHLVLLLYPETHLHSPTWFNGRHSKPQKASERERKEGRWYICERGRREAKLIPTRVMPQSLSCCTRYYWIFDYDTVFAWTALARTIFLKFGVKRSLSIGIVLSETAVLKTDSCRIN